MYNAFLSRNSSKNGGGGIIIIYEGLCPVNTEVSFNPVGVVT